MDYDYQNEDVYESNERFYFEFKTAEQQRGQDDLLAESEIKPAPYKLEFDLVQCVYVQLNVSLSNATLVKQVRHFTHGKSYMSLSRSQLRHLFSLNRHNGVLSSRRIINAMLPGVYLFTIDLRLVNRSNLTADADRTHFKLIILPPATSIAHSAVNYTANFYKFDREFYKFKAQSLGHIRLVNRMQTIDAASSHKIRFKLIENKFSKQNSKLVKNSEKLLCNCNF